MLSFLSSLVLGGVALAMFARAHFEFTKTVALVPALMAGVELFFASVLEPGLFPVLTALLMVFRVAVVALGVFTLREDAKMAKKREETRRRANRQILCATHGLEPVVAKRVESARLSKVA